MRRSKGPEEPEPEHWRHRLRNLHGTTAFTLGVVTASTADGLEKVH
jgi:hypothetical protein